MELVRWSREVLIKEFKSFSTGFLSTRLNKIFERNFDLIKNSCVKSSRRCNGKQEGFLLESERERRASKDLVIPTMHTTCRRARSIDRRFGHINLKENERGKERIFPKKDLLGRWMNVGDVCVNEKHLRRLFFNSNYFYYSGKSKEMVLELKCWNDRTLPSLQRSAFSLSLFSSMFFSSSSSSSIRNQGWEDQQNKTTD